MSKTISIFELQTCNAKLIDGQFVKITFLGDEKYTVNDLAYITDTILEFMDGVKFVSLIDFSRYFGTFSLDVKQFLANHKGLEKFKYQEAFVIRKLGMRIQANFYFKINPSMRIKVFSNEDKAIEWLLKMREDILL